MINKLRLFYFAMAISQQMDCVSLQVCLVLHIGQSRVLKLCAKCQLKPTSAMENRLKALLNCRIRDKLTCFKQISHCARGFQSSSAATRDCPGYLGTLPINKCLAPLVI